jgi:hypothetical protein
VLAAGIGIVTKDEGSKHRPVDGPGPGERGLHADLERDEDRKQQGEAFSSPLLLVVKFANANERSKSAASLSTRATAIFVALQ